MIADREDHRVMTSLVEAMVEGEIWDRIGHCRVTIVVRRVSQINK